MERYTVTEDNLIKTNIYKTSINDVYYIDRPYHEDSRGFFSEVMKVPELSDVLGFQFAIKQVNHARSNTNVVRGIHAEGWNKYIFITQGVCFCAIVDVRPESSTFGNKDYFVIGSKPDNLHGCLYLPSGIGNSVCVLEGPVDYIYLVDKLYADRDTSGDVAISVFDPDINIEWPIPREQMILSDRDINSITVREKYPHKFAK